MRLDRDADHEFVRVIGSGVEKKGERPLEVGDDTVLDADRRPPHAEVEEEFGVDLGERGGADLVGEPAEAQLPQRAERAGTK